MKNPPCRYWIGALTLIAFVLSGAALWADEVEKRVVKRRVITDCDNLEIAGAEGKGVRVMRLASGGFLGVELTSLTPELRRHFGVPAEYGVMIGRVVEDSPAAAAGLAVGDVITRVDGEEISSGSKLGRVVRAKKGGETADVEYWRDGRSYRATVTLDEQERCAFDMGQIMEGIDLSELGDVGALSGEAIETALESLREIDWEKHFEGLKEIDLEAFERQMEQMQERLEQLEIRLEREERSDRDRERERDRERGNSPGSRPL